MAELGVGDLANRRDDACAVTVLVDASDNSIAAAPSRSIRRHAPRPIKALRDEALAERPAM